MLYLSHSSWKQIIQVISLCGKSKIIPQINYGFTVYAIWKKPDDRTVVSDLNHSWLNYITAPSLSTLSTSHSNKVFCPDGFCIQTDLKSSTVKSHPEWPIS